MGVCPVLPTVAAEEQEEHVEQFAEHLPPAWAFDVADGVEHTEELVDDAELGFVELEMGLVGVEEVVAEDVEVLPLHFFLELG